MSRKERISFLLVETEDALELRLVDVVGDRTASFASCGAALDDGERERDSREAVGESLLVI